MGDSGVGKTSLTSLLAQGTSLPSPGWHVFFHTVHGIILVHDLANRKSCLNLGRWLAEVTRAESGSHKYSLAQAGGAWGGGNISGTDIGEVSMPLLVVGTKADVASGSKLPLHTR